MLNNLNAEQKRRGLTNEQVADIIGVAENTYIWKKRTGKFFRHEILKLMEFFDCEFDYLFKDSMQGGDTNAQANQEIASGSGTDTSGIGAENGI